jgi:hypothetical protein
MERLLDFDPVTWLKTFHDYDDASDTTIIRYEQDVEPILDANKHDLNHADKKMGELAHVARVPIGVQLEWYVKHGVRMWDPNHKKAVARLLDSSDYRYLKRMPIMLGNH